MRPFSPFGVEERAKIRQDFVKNDVNMISNQKLASQNKTISRKSSILLLLGIFVIVVLLIAFHIL
jgi:hypothetical protein